MKLGPRQQKWVEALESEEYEQGSGSLCKEVSENRKQYCCLGVLCDLHKDHLEVTTDYKAYRYDGKDDFLPDYLAEKLAFHSRIGNMTRTLDEPDEVQKMRLDYQNLVEINDGSGYTFKQIAALIRSCPEAFFKESR